MKRIGFSVLLLSGLAACTTVSGDVDGESPAAGEAFFIQEDEAYGEDGRIQVVITDVPDACVALTAFTEDSQEALSVTDFDIEEYIDAYQDHLPEESWVTSITLRVDDPSDDLKGTEYEAVEYDAALEDDDEFRVQVQRRDRYPDDDDFDSITDIWDSLVDPDWQEVYTSDEGHLKITAHSQNESIRGSVSDVYLKDSDGDDAGELDASFNATRCREFEDLLD